MIYEYVCVECKHEWEENQPAAEYVRQTHCPECKKESAQRLIGKTSFQLKGTGWFNSGGYGA